MAELRVARDLALPLDVAGEAIAILGKRGAGKTHTAVVLVEELLDAKVQVVVLDPVGSWWGLRSKYEVPILGGAHADLPLEPTAGKLLAKVVHDSGQSVVLDTNSFTSKGKVASFVTDFLDTLYRLLGADPRLIHVVLEEADEFAPQKPFKDETRMLSAVEQAVRRGRGRGLGMTMVSQRAAVLNKNVLEQADVLVAMRVTGPNDRAAIQAWIGKHDELEQTVEPQTVARTGKTDQVVTRMSAGMSVIQSLPKLQNGEAWFWNPERGLLKMVKVRQRRSLDVSGRIKAGQQQKKVTLKPIDLAKLGEQIAETVEKQKENDPKELKARVRQLEAELAKGARAPAAVETIEQPVLQNGELKTLKELLDRAGVLSGQLEQRISDVHAAGDAFEAHRRELDKALVEVHRELTRISGARAPLAGVGTGARRAPAAERSPAPTPAVPRNVQIGDTDAARGHDGDEAPRLKAGARRIVEALASHHPMALTRSQIATLAKLKKTGGTFGAYWSAVKVAGLIDEQGTTTTLTEAGLDYARELGFDVGVPKTGEELLEMWRGRLKAGARNMLDHLVEIGGQWTTREELGQVVGLETSGGTFGAYLSMLRTAGLAETDGQNVRASETLFLGAAA